MKIRALQHAMREIGYTAIQEGYVFPDVFSASGQDRRVALAAFTHEPPSYRNAALGVVEAGGREATEVARECRALGAPLLFVIEDERITVCEVHPQQRPTIYREASWSQIETLFNEHREFWKPQRIHNAKSFGFLRREYQLDFVDIGLMSAIEGEIHGKLDRLLNETLAGIVRMRVIRAGERVDDLLIFRTVFRLLAAKVLQDKEHELAQSWNAEDIDSVLQRISGFYRLPTLAGEGGSLKGTVFESAWNRLRAGINFRNISSDDLAFVYENTLVTEETRKHFGVHSTPRAVAEYVVRRIEIDNVNATTVYEPFAGAGVFMVAALGRLRDLLPITMSARERHRFLVDRIRGDEIEPFAKEVATLSLILADYPNENGWAVSAIDLFKNNNLANRAQGSSIILCNPPFEKFTPVEREQYPKAIARSPRKPIAVIDAALEVRPNALGFVFPETFIGGPHYRRQREQVEKLYKDIEVIALPDRVFKASTIRSSLLIAQQPRSAVELSTTVRSTSVYVRDRERFLKTSQVSETRVKQRPFNSVGRLWIDELDELWEYLTELPRFETIANVHRGIEWKDHQSQATRLDEARGFRLGIHSGDAIGAFVHNKPLYLDCRPSRLRGGAIRYAWDAPKILANAARLSRGPWCFAAAIDRRKLVASQQLFGIWPSEKGDFSLEAICALLNNPLVVAYIACHSPPDRIRVATVESVPTPKVLPDNLDTLVGKYLFTLNERKQLFSVGFEDRANSALQEIDAEILRAYDLPPRMERRLLEYFRGNTRPTSHAWKHWFPEGFEPFIPLHEYLSSEYQAATKPWERELFAPLQEDEAKALSQYMG